MKALTDGVWFNGSSIESFARIQESDYFLNREALVKHMFERYVDVKTKEWDEFKHQVTK